MAMNDEEAIVAVKAGSRLELIAESFTRLTGEMLVDTQPATARSLWDAPRVILAHGMQDDPLFFYGNKMALDLFEMPARDFLGMPSRLSAEAPIREERARLFERVTRDGLIRDYAGVRISATGRRFRIEQATVWTLIDAAGRIHGQAAAFDQWTELA